MRPAPCIPLRDGWGGSDPGSTHPGSTHERVSRLGCRKPLESALPTLGGPRRETPTPLPAVFQFVGPYMILCPTV